MGPGLPSPFGRNQRLRAVLFDLDGTLYSQRLLRALMLIELLALPLRRPFTWWRTWRTISAYRSAQESLRTREGTTMSAAAQVNVAAVRVSLPAADVETIVQEWMFDRPLKYLKWCRASGIVSFLEFLARRRVEIGLLSDYPAGGKLYALGLSGRFAPVLCSSDPEIGVFKPDPRGLLRASDVWGVAPSEVLVVGDRLDVDAAGAAAAGMPCVIIGQSSAVAAGRANLLALPSFERLHRVLDECR
jgi:FMN phosphatase YigB (HAD superfamily)